jgi:hypothetical protein
VALIKYGGKVGLWRNRLRREAGGAGLYCVGGIASSVSGVTPNNATHSSHGGLTVQRFVTAVLQHVHVGAQPCWATVPIDSTRRTTASGEPAR